MYDAITERNFGNVAVDGHGQVTRDHFILYRIKSLPSIHCAHPGLFISPLQKCPVSFCCCLPGISFVCAQQTWAVQQHTPKALRREVLTAPALRCLKLLAPSFLSVAITALPAVD